MVLSDADIHKAIRRGELGIEPFQPKSLTPNGYDLSVESVLVPGTGIRTGSGSASIPPKAWFVISTEERVRLGRGIAAQLWLRTTYARKGVLGAFGKIDAGFDGTLTISAFNASEQAVDIPVGERFCQMVLERLDSPAEKVYAERSGKYQGQKGITLARVDAPARAPLAAPDGPAADAPCRREGCSHCCQGTEMPLTKEDVSRISNLGFGPEQFIHDVEGWLQLRNTEGGHCIFLRFGLCSIYPDRPEGCRLYPIVFDVDGNEAVLDPDCPHRRGFGLSAGRGRVVRSLADRLGRERRERRFRKGGPRHTPP